MFSIDIFFKKRIFSIVLIFFFPDGFQEDQADHIKLLSFLKCGHHGLNIAPMETYFSASISDLKSQLEQYVAFKCNSGSTRFVEYWVPAPLSSLQLEQYCSMLLSNSMLLCSVQKFDSVDALHDLVISTRKVDMMKNGISNKLKHHLSHIFCCQPLVKCSYDDITYSTFIKAIALNALSIGQHDDRCICG